jgi:hypothetical protein
MGVKYMEVIAITTPIVKQQISEQNIFEQIARDVPVYKIGIVEHKDEFKQIPNQHTDENGDQVYNSPEYVDCIKLKDFVECIQNGNYTWTLDDKSYIPISKNLSFKLDGYPTGWINPGHIFRFEFMSESDLLDKQINELTETIEKETHKLNDLKVKLQDLIVKSKELT